MASLDFAQACSLTAGGSMWSSVAIPGAGIPAFTMSDGPLGIASGRVDERDIALLCPCTTLLGATWDRDLCRAVGALVGSEASSRRIDAVLAPNLNLARSPLAGRAFEYFSEDPVLTGVLGGQWITGLQSTGTGSVAKHLVCNDSETDRDKVDVRVDERTLREVYLMPFRYAVDAGCAALLAAYNRVNGAWCTENHHILTEIVKGEWGFSGAIMSDWFGTHSGAGSINAGLDLEMPGPARFMGTKLAEGTQAFARGRIEDAAARVVHTARSVTGPKAAPVPSDKADALLVEAAAAGFTLLRNEEALLPLVPGTLKKLAVIGPNAFVPCFQGGTFAKIAISPDAPTPAQTLRAVYGQSCEVLCEPGVDPQPRLPAMPVSPALDIGDGCTRGMTLEYFGEPGCSGPVLTRETRDTNSLVWFVGVHEQSAFDRPGSVRASGRFRAERSGMHRFYLGSTGAARLSLDGSNVLQTGGAIAASDVMGMLKAGDAETAEVMLEAGREVVVTAEFDHGAARVHGLWYGVRGPDGADEMLERAVAAARAADAVVLIVGETPDSSVESRDRTDTALPPEQLRLIEQVTAANPRTAVIVNVGHAFDTAWEARAGAVLVVWYPGQGYARALADVLTGMREPGGRLPLTLACQDSDYPALSLKPGTDGKLGYEDGTRFGYRGLIAKNIAARHPFGSGLGYADIVWRDVAYADGGLHAVLENPSSRRASDVVQVYRDVPETALVGFSRATLAPGETRRVTLPIELAALQLWNGDGWKLPDGYIALRIARHCEDSGVTVHVPVADLR